MNTVSHSPSPAKGPLRASRSIYTRIIINRVTLAVAVTVGLLWLFQYVVIPSYTESVVSRARDTAFYVQTVTPHLTTDQEQDLLENLQSRHPELSYILVIDRNGKALTHSDRGRIGMIFSDPASIASARATKIIEQIYTRDMENPHSPFYGERVIDIAVPNFDKSGKQIGAISVGLSLRSLDTIRIRCYLALAALVAVAGVALAVGMAQTSRDIIKPVQRMERAAREIQQGCLDTRIPVSRDDEIGRLAGSFNLMSETISSLLADLESKRKDLQEYVDQLTTFSAKMTPDGTLLMVNRAAAELAGTSYDNLTGRKFWETPWWSYSESTQEKVMRAVESAASGSYVRFEVAHVRSAADPVISDVTLVPVHDENKQVLYLIAEGRDITERKRAEEALAKSGERFRGVVEHSPIGIFQSTVGGRFIDVNHAFAHTFGWDSPEELVNSVTDIAKTLFVHPEKRNDIVRRVLESDSFVRVENEYRRKDGSIIFANLYMRAVRSNGGVAYLEGFVEEITERKIAEEALRESQRALQTLMSNIPGMAYRCMDNKDWTMQFVSEGCEELTGYPSTALTWNTEVSYGDIIHPDDQEMVWDQVQTGLTQRKPFRLVYRIITASGEEKWVWEQGRGVFSPRGEVLAIEGLITDITERMRAETEKKAFYRQAVRSVTQGKLDLVPVEDTQGFIDSAGVRTKITTPADTAAVRTELEVFMISQGLLGDSLTLFLTGIGEAMTNALKHAGEGRVYAGISGQEIWAAVTDTGPGIATFALPNATLQAGFSTKVSLGMGYSIMMDVSDRILLSTGNYGTTVLLTKDPRRTDRGLKLEDLPDTWNDMESKYRTG